VFKLAAWTICPGQNCWWRFGESNESSHKFLGLDAADAPITDFSIAIDTPEITRQKTREAADFPVLKIKVGLNSDEAANDPWRGVRVEKGKLLLPAGAGLGLTPA
jgi:hypothetical protein